MTKTTPCGYNGRCKTTARIALKLEESYKERTACARHARVLMSDGWGYIGALDGKEQWRPSPGHPGYDISDRGRVRSWLVSGHGDHRMHAPALLKTPIGTGGYPRLTIYVNGKKRYRSVHTLVLEAFVGPCPPGQEVRHYPDNTKTNNRLGNLLWGTREEQWGDRRRDGTDNAGERNGQAKLTNAKVKKIFRLIDTGWSVMDLARRFGVHHSRISGIKNGLTWLSVTRIKKGQRYASV